MPAEHELPISVKGILGPPGRVALLRNERGEWELPGGRLEPRDSGLPEALRREVAEELGLDVVVGRPVHVWRYQPIPAKTVLLVAYQCTLNGVWPAQLTHSSEHNDVGTFAVDHLDGLNLPEGYRRAISLSVAAP